ncbi:DUF1715-domain-containing protein [Ceratobasidium sp. AG-I]|nr:DUF1715-domain-containing protein [Ceratobasidium sp. AG-I]
MEFDIGDLAHLEESLYTAGHEDGFQHGRIHGLIEGRALGREKGFEMWEELGFYEGFAGLWLKAGTGADERATRHAEQLLSLISKFPMTNPSMASEAGSELDIVRLFTQIRSRYKALCSTLGVRPRLLASGAISSGSPTGGDDTAQVLSNNGRSSGMTTSGRLPNPTPSLAF